MILPILPNHGQSAGCCHQALWPGYKIGMGSTKKGYKLLIMMMDSSFWVVIVQLGTKVNTKLGLPPTTHHHHKLFCMKERSQGSQILYITFTNINKTVHKVLTILWGGRSIAPSPPLRVKPIYGLRFGIKVNSSPS